MCTFVQLSSIQQISRDVELKRNWKQHFYKAQIISPTISLISVCVIVCTFHTHQNTNEHRKYSQRKKRKIALKVQFSPLQMTVKRTKTIAFVATCRRSSGMSSANTPEAIVCAPIPNPFVLSMKLPFRKCRHSIPAFRNAKGSYTRL